MCRCLVQQPWAGTRQAFCHSPTQAESWAGKIQAHSEPWHPAAPAPPAPAPISQSPSSWGLGRSRPQRAMLAVLGEEGPLVPRGVSGPRALRCLSPC